MTRSGAAATAAQGTPSELLRALAVLAEPPGPAHQHLARLVGLEPPPDDAAFTELFVLQLRPYAAIYLGPEGMLGGVARSRIAGFWHALGYVPPAEPDHLSALLGLYAGLLERTKQTGGADAVLFRSSHEALLQEHLAPWVFGFLDRVRELDRQSFGRWADVLEQLLFRELGRAGPHPGPLHFRDAPDLPDPRRDGGRAFLEGLLAPVRAGMIVTRRRLVALAHELGLAVRVGERRYVLEHLLGLDAAGVLAGLAAEARRQGAAHRGRTQLLGETAAFQAERARHTAELLDQLAMAGAGAAP